MKTKTVRNTSGLIPAKKGEVRNKTGRNGLKSIVNIKEELKAMFDQEAEDEETGKKTTKLQSLLRRTYKYAMEGSYNHQKLLFEYGFGRPSMAPEDVSALSEASKIHVYLPLRNGEDPSKATATLDIMEGEVIETKEDTIKQ